MTTTDQVIDWESAITSQDEIAPTFEAMQRLLLFGLPKRLRPFERAGTRHVPDGGRAGGQLLERDWRITDRSDGSRAPGHGGAGVDLNQTGGPA